MPREMPSGSTYWMWDMMLPFFKRQLCTYQTSEMECSSWGWHGEVRKGDTQMNEGDSVVPRWYYPIHPCLQHTSKMKRCVLFSNDRVRLLRKEWWAKRRLRLCPTPGPQWPCDWDQLLCKICGSLFNHLLTWIRCGWEGRAALHCSLVVSFTVLKRDLLHIKGRPVLKLHKHMLPGT